MFYDLPCSVSICSGGSIVKFSKFCRLFRCTFCPRAWPTCCASTGSSQSSTCTLKISVMSCWRLRRNWERETEFSWGPWSLTIQKGRHAELPVDNAGSSAQLQWNTTTSCSTWPPLQALAEAFRVNKAINEVDLSRNQIGNEGVKARAQPRGDGCGAAGLWNENDGIEEFNQILQMEIILASSAFFLGTCSDFSIFRESVLARTFTSLFVPWIGGPTYNLLDQ